MTPYLWQTKNRGNLTLVVGANTAFQSDVAELEFGSERFEKSVFNQALRIALKKAHPKMGLKQFTLQSTGLSAKSVERLVRQKV